MKIQKLAQTWIELSLVCISILPIICSASPRDAQGLDNQFDFKGVSEFNTFLESFKTMGVDQLNKERVPERFIEDRTAILDLEKVISSEEVCAYHKIDELVNYHKTYFASKIKIKPITHHFFKKFAVQVAYTCKSNLLQNLRKAREELGQNSKVFEEAKKRVFNEEPSVRSNIKLLQEQPSEPATANVKPKDDFELTLGEYREALARLKRPEDILTFDADECKESKHRYTKVSSDKLQTFLKPALMCHQLHRYYAGSILSIARLANIGYMALNDILDKQLLEDPMLRDWIMAAQVCDPMLHLYSKELIGEWAVVDNCAPAVPIIELVVYQDSITRFDEELLRDMIPRSEASRSGAQKLMKSAFKSMAKANIMKQLQSGAGVKGIFKKSLTMFAAKSDRADAAQKAETHIPAKFLVQLSEEVQIPNSELADNFIERPKSEQESYETLMKALNAEGSEKDLTGKRNGIDSAVSFFDPMSTMVSFFTVMVIMMSFEWLFFIVMTLAARICHHMYFNFDNLLTFPPKVLSWSGADFARLSDQIERVDEDDFYDYDELNPNEREQRDLLKKVFGKPPPMLYRD